MNGNLELGVLCTGIGFFSYNVLPSLHQHDAVYAGALLLYMLLSGVLQQQWFLIENDHPKFRIPDPGILYCLPLPLSVCMWTEDEARFITLLIPLSLLVYVGHSKRSFVCNMLVGILFIGVLGHIMLYNRSELGLTVVLCCMYTLMLHALPMCFDKTFSFGELSVVCEIYIYIMYCVLRTCIKQETHEAPVIEKAAATIFVTLNILVVLMCILKWLKVTALQSVTTILLAGMITLLCVIHWFLPPREIKVLMVQVLGSNLSIILLLWWICCTSISILIVCYYGNRKSTFKHENGADINSKRTSYKSSSNNTQDMYETYTDIKKDLVNEKLKTKKNHQVELLQSAKPNFKSNSSDQVSLTNSYKHMGEPVPMFVRKYFHVVILGVFIPGMMFHHRLLYVASCAAAAMFLLIEVVRILDVPLISREINKYLTVFLDKQDQGDLILTPIYLLIGCSLPLWIIRPKLGSSCSLVHYSGLLSVGVGDAAASIVGRKFGYHTWPGSKKTVEGTLAAILSQLVFLIFLHFAGVPEADVSIATVAILILVSSLEAFTKHIDNLVVPVFATLLFSSIEYA